MRHPTIRASAKEHGSPAYAFSLVKRVGVETVRIVQALPPLRLPDK